MKGQLTLEYLLSIMVFIGIVSYIFLLYNRNIPLFIDEVVKEDTRAKTFQLSEILLNDPGEPQDWNSGNVKRIGLSDHRFNLTNLISKEKMNKLNSMCRNNFQNVQEKLAFDKPFSVLVLKIDDRGDRTETLLDCRSPDLTKTTINVTVTRITAYTFGNKRGLAEMIVQV